VKGAPNCRSCLFFKISGDPSFPFTCSQFEIKSARLPSFEVFLATGHHCPVYQPNPKLKKAQDLDKNGWIA